MTNPFSHTRPAGALAASASFPELGTAPGVRSSFWQRIVADLTLAITQGRYLPGQRLPSEHALAKQFGVNRHTIRRALANLSQQGLVRTSQGSGSYVEAFAVELMLSRRTRLRQNLALIGMKGSLRLLGSQVEAASEAVALKLRLSASSPVLRLQVLAEADGQPPLSMSQRYFPRARFPHLEQVLQTTGSLTAAFAAHGVSDYTRAESRISADIPDSTLASQLHLPPTRPVLRVDSLNVDNAGVPIEWARAWYAADRVALTVDHGNQVGGAP